VTTGSAGHVSGLWPAAWFAVGSSYGSDWWLIYWFIISLVAAFCFRGVLGVKT
jgi:hypothetical protein